MLLHTSAQLLFVLGSLLQEGSPPMPAEKSDVILLPPNPLYVHPLADPRSPYSGTRLQFPLHRGDNIKSESVLGGNFALVRFPGEEGDVELEFEAAAFSRFDLNENLDMDAVDYRFGFPLVYRDGPLAWKLHLWHITSHLGDEYAERTGRKRIRYGRNELAFGASWDASDAWRVYGEMGWGFLIGEPNEPGRAMGGAEWVKKPAGSKFPEVFAAANIGSFQESDWHLNLAAQLGLWVRTDNSPRGYRFGFEYYRGHSPLTQFFEQREEYWSFGLWVHF